MENKSQHILAIASPSSALVAWLPMINEVVQILAGTIAVISGSIYLYRLLKGKKES